MCMKNNDIKYVKDVKQSSVSKKPRVITKNARVNKRLTLQKT